MKDKTTLSTNHETGLLTKKNSSKSKINIKNVLKWTGIGLGTAAFCFLGYKYIMDDSIPVYKNDPSIDKSIDKLIDDYVKTTVDFLTKKCEENNGTYLISEHIGDNGEPDKWLYAELTDQKYD